MKVIKPQKMFLAPQFERVSGSQLGCREIVSGVPPVFPFYRPLNLFKHVGVPPNIDIADQGCREAKKVAKHWTKACENLNPDLVFVCLYERDPFHMNLSFGNDHSTIYFLFS